MKNLEQNLKDEIKPVYHIVGDDVFLLDSACKILENVCENEMGDINVSIFNDENFNADLIIEACNQIPMLAKKRFVLVKDVLKVGENDLKQLVQYCKQPYEDCLLVFCEVPGLNVFGKVSAEKVDCKKLDNFALGKFVDEEFSNYGKSITPEAREMLITFCSKEIFRIKNEILKLAFYDENIKVIEPDIVKKLVHQNDEFSVFEISNALTSGSGDKAIVLMNSMLETMAFPQILGLIASHFRRMLYSKISVGATGEIAETLGVKEFAVIKAKQLASKFTPMQLVRIYELILQVDFDIKSGKMSSENAMFFLVFNIVSLVKGGKN